MNNRINIVLFGIGNVGSALINKVLKERKGLALDNKIDLRFPVITNSSVAFFEKEGVNFSWEANFIQFGIPFKMEDVVQYLHANNISNLIAVDASGDDSLPLDYTKLLKSGFNVVSVNKNATGLPASFKDEVKLAASVHGLEALFLGAPKDSRGEIVQKLFEALVEIAEKQKKIAA
ncbi:hypothetical protein GN157_02790 [Flavobacterium rakeshii]|uniref:Aspartate/homoserine dehydrogenase NAD-binding domain-containing protein n=1 Tax=Flavobacterium rakeshii TaxID=1038845 RepID=A0A6N8HDR4_9FLAO|nr:hypothetical protein [Flavobacterium rakeshii]MUV02627.1 hypothetical protein [Flavobacterium rakeshii]